MRYLYFQIEQKLLRMRWLLPIPTILFISYIVIGGVLVRARNYGLSSNSWDALFSVFGNGNLIFFVLNPLYLYLVSDMFLESGIGQLALLRVGSRRRWWLSKVLILGLAVFCYTGLNVGIVAMTATFVLPWDNSWSQAVLQYPQEFNLNPEALTISSTSAIRWLLLLLSLGWFSMGLLVMCFTLLSNHYLVGFTAGVIANFSGLVALRANLPLPYAYLSIHQHLLFNLHSFGDVITPYPSLPTSIYYWVLWCSILLIVGFKFAHKQDFIHREQ
ncbi:ABC-2 family transporter protein [Bellilinea caldifistulae]|uniref:hypothetical protein n=1 Tax=Bellilinea caldifistulae TaxID=360411 RepID=UPI0011AEA7A6|nr:hypothetical protein [Bellilinea caldifistulae]GAP10015.1 ABC-2 family transporter protein [Bellilinea caldifistulae]